MRINGTLIGTLRGHSEKSTALVDRVLEIYATKTKLKFYLFKSCVKGWHSKSQLLQVVDHRVVNCDESTIIRDYVNMLMNINNIRFNDTFTYNGVKYHYSNGFEVYEVDNGTMFKDIDSKISYCGQMGENGNYYKDLNAWNTNKGVIYIGEYGLDELTNETDPATLWTRESWIKWVVGYITYNYADEADFKDMIACTEFIEHLALDCLENADWQDLSTLLNDYDYNNDWIMGNWTEWKNK